jgi:hypothetical protein
MRWKMYFICISADVHVHYFLDFGKDCSRRQHLTVFVRAVDADELRVELALLPVDVPYAFLELYVGFMDVLAAFEIVSVLSSALALEL